MSPEYLPSGSDEAPVQAERTYLTPRPGHGSVWVNWLDKTQDRWIAYWDDGDDRQTTLEGSEEAVLVWAKSQPAARRLIYSSEHQEFIALE